ncbi:MAG: pseudouridine synthase [Mycoplasmatales bacterium]|nr:pseudouridine synthase [Mycoplasmatales bacterium]
MRIDRFISTNTIYSRSDVKKFIKKKRVFVNDKLIKDSSFQIEGTEKIELNKEIIKAHDFIYYILDKPKGFISATRDFKHKTIIELIPEKYKHLNLKPVGRLDKDTTGLIILTNDNDFIHTMTSPKNNVIKKYQVTLADNIQSNYKEKIKKGIILKDGTITKPGEFEIIDDKKCFLTITEGKYHQVKRMFAALGNKVVELRRIQFGEYKIT